MMAGNVMRIPSTSRIQMDNLMGINNSQTGAFDQGVFSSSNMDQSEMGCSANDMRGRMEKSDKETIHSGHFMVSEIDSEEKKDNDAPLTSHESDLETADTQMIEESQRMQTFDLETACRDTTEVYTKHSQSVMIDSSLTKLFECMSLAYQGKITSPRWKNFKGLRLRLKEKIRLNNIIWRAWHIQYILCRSPLVCQFSAPGDLDSTHNKPEAIVLEGKYWKRKLATVCAEYKKWRLFFKDKTKVQTAKQAAQADWERSWPSAFFNSNSMPGFGADDDFAMDFTDTLFNTLMQQPNSGFDFPDPREIARPGMTADFIQPGLTQLQPVTDDFMDTFEPLHEILSSKPMGSSLPTLPEEPPDTQSSSELQQNDPSALTQESAPHPSISGDANADLYASLMTPQPQLDPEPEQRTKQRVTSDSSSATMDVVTSYGGRQIGNQHPQVTTQQIIASQKSESNSLTQVQQPRYRKYGIKSYQQQQQQISYDMSSMVACTSPSQAQNQSVGAGSSVIASPRVQSQVPSQVQMSSQSPNTQSPAQAVTQYGYTTCSMSSIQSPARTQQAQQFSSQGVAQYQQTPQQVQSQSSRQVQLQPLQPRRSLPAYIRSTGSNSNTQLSSGSQQHFAVPTKAPPKQSRFRSRSASGPAPQYSSPANEKIFQLVPYLNQSPHPSQQNASPSSSSLVDVTRVEPSQSQQSQQPQQSLSRPTLERTSSLPVYTQRPNQNQSPFTTFSSDQIMKLNAQQHQQSQSSTDLSLGSVTVNNSGSQGSLAFQTASITVPSSIYVTASPSQRQQNSQQIQLQTSNNVLLAQIINAASSGSNSTSISANSLGQSFQGTNASQPQQTIQYIVNTGNSPSRTSSSPITISSRPPAVRKTSPNAVDTSSLSISATSSEQNSARSVTPSTPVPQQSVIHQTNVSDAASQLAALQQQLLQQGSGSSGSGSFNAASSLTWRQLAQITAQVSGTSIQTTTNSDNKSSALYGSGSIGGSPAPPSPASPPSFSPGSSLTNISSRSFGGCPTPKVKSDEERTQYKEHRRVCHINAEQKRRCNIKNGFDTLRCLLPSVNQNSSTKVSKAAMLQKAAEHIKALKTDRQQQQEEYDLLKQQIDSLNQTISVFQGQLPATGAPVPCQRTSHLKELYEEYVRMRTLNNWKFWVFSTLADPLFDSYNSTVSTANVDDFCKTVLRWLDQSCSLVTLRKETLNALRHISTSTNILTNPSTLPQEAMDAVTKKENKSSSNSSSASSIGPSGAAFSSSSLGSSSASYYDGN